MSRVEYQKGEIKLWSERNYVFTHNPDDRISRKSLWEHYKISNPNPTISRCIFSRFFTEQSKVPHESHTTKHILGVKLQEHPETPCPDSSDDEEETLSVAECNPVIMEWFSRKYEWTTTPENKIEKKAFYEAFRRDNPSVSFPDNMIGLTISKNSPPGLKSTKRYWKGLINKTCPTCGREF